jgi:hypothetical protein
LERFLTRTIAAAVLLGVCLTAYHILEEAYRTTQAVIPDVVTPSVIPAADASGATAVAPVLPSSPPIRFRLGGWPLEYWMLGWFLLVIGLERAGSHAGPDLSQRFRKYVFWAATVAMCGVAWIVNEARTTQRTLELHALVVSVCVLSVFLASALSRQSSMTAIGRHALQDIRVFVGRTATWAGATVFIGAVAVGSAFAPRPGTPTGAEFVRWYRTQPHINMPFLTRPNSVLVVKFNDYQCPGCIQGYLEHTPVLTRLAEQTNGAVAMTMLDYPIDMECNPYVTMNSHPAACEAAAAVRLARERGREADMERWLWDQQGVLSVDTILTAVAEIAGVHDFSDRYKGVLDDIRADVEKAQTLGVNGTPIYFVNGVRVPFVPAADLDAAIRIELERVRSASRPPAPGN